MYVFFLIVGVKMRGVTEVTLQSDSLTDPSVATFSGITIDTGIVHEQLLVYRPFLTHLFQRKS